MSDNAKSVRYECTRCGNCCRWDGYVRLTADDIDAIADFLGVSKEDFVAAYTAVTDDRRSLTLIENDMGYCIMLTPDGLCRINPVKPKQCRDFPNKWNFPGFEKLCRARKIEE